MKAVRYYGKEDVRIDDVEEPELTPGTVKIEPAFNGICGSDLSLYFSGVIPPAPSADEPHPLSGETLPVIFGHEFSGVVEAVADDVEHVAVGERVVVEPLMVDGTCEACQQGRYNLCENMGFIGISGRGGGLSEHIVVEKRWVHSVGDLPLDQAALIEPLAVATHAVNKTPVLQGQTAVVGGAGPIGLLVASVLHARGVHVIISEMSEARKAFARESGVADLVLDPTRDDVVARVKESTDGRGAEVVFDCAGVQAVFDTLLDCLTIGGHLEVVAIYSKPVEFDIAGKITMSEKMIGSSISYAGDHQDAIEMATSGKIDLAQFITSTIAPEDIVEQGFRRLRDHGESEIKILVEL